MRVDACTLCLVASVALGCGDGGGRWYDCTGRVTPGLRTRMVGSRTECFCPAGGFCHEDLVYPDTNLPDAAQDAPELSDAGAADADLDADLDATVTDASAADATVSTDGGVTDLDSP